MNTVKRGPYRTKEVQMKDFNGFGEKVMARCGFLVGIQRVSAWRDCEGGLHPAGWNVAINGQTFFVVTIDAGISLLEGFLFGLDVNEMKIGGRGYLTKVDAIDLIHAEIRRFIGETLETKGVKHV